MFIKKPKLELKTAWGFFNEQHEYVITRPDTPKPWINYLSNSQYHALVSQTGGGYSYYKDSKLHRILHWENFRSDRPGRYVFIKDQKTGEVWTPNWQPLCKRLDYWQATHGFGYSSIYAAHQNMEATLTYFVPPEASCEVWVTTFKNTSLETKTLSIYPYVHWLLGDFYMEQDHKNIMVLYNEGYYDPALQSIVAFKHPNSSRKYETYGFFASSLKPSGYELNYEKFVGKYGSISNPKMLKKGKLSSEPVRGEEMVGVMEIPLTLKPQQEVTCVFVLGFTEKKSDIEKIIKDHVKPQEAKHLLQKTKVMWETKLSGMKVETPDPQFNLMTNFWGKYQLLHITRWRSASFYSPGEGGRGYRDTAQDVEGVASIDPFLCREWIERLLTYQYKSGHAVAGFSDIEGPWEIGTDKGILGKSDVAVWIPFMVSTYVKETGDKDFLQKEISFLDGDKASVWEHCLRAMEHFWKSRGEHGLPLFWKADWNDALDRCGIQGKGESVWLGQAYARALLCVEEMALWLGKKEDEALMHSRYEEMKKIINDVGWDGDWYRCVFTDSQKILGSKTGEANRVYLNTQSWAILSKVAPELRAEKCFRAIEEHLETEMGPAMFSPYYTQYDPQIGRMTAFAPGTKENAAIFSHACAFLIVSYAMSKKGKKAYELFTKIAPYNPAKTVERYQTEPYVYAEYCYGPGNAQFGMGAFNWNTGTAAWMFIAATQWMVGVRPVFEGLMIDPCVPSHWKTFSIERAFRGALYKIHIENPEGVESGVKEVTVDGKRIEGNVIPQMPAGKVYEVHVLMG
ncbi:MAG: hypothetical protein A2Z91_07575 [Deltaproteobacteria bacterium GWA2_38_16]|nr:MAG: hypothetical protein A2Z91_07575 [Deltaproteobacteria bacterium GWA2_38_16]OGQ03096.1 MAG: hypothetical protein A3D19_03495 [Deltaproteobacteria bacterium RIFCSPHIGHO2_02_FULL_38_15]OGQ31472.1 MAG: hypothetical protein A3A72_01395 [Deltaproteobacteria bacterium RIFCSPLOWO2_01_FULL_38_9]HBQ20486.1 hypothetical protein [Deltaproteobacteria bacterium]